MSIALPKKKIKKETDDPSIIVIYGAPKVGKTKISSELENNLIIDLEKGTKHIEALKINANNIQEFKEIYSQIIKDGKPYKYITIDTIDIIEDWCEELATKEYISTDIGKNFDGDSVLELSHGAGYYWIRKSFKKILKSLPNLAEHIIIVGHLKDKLVDKKKGEITAKDLTLSAGTSKILCAAADAIGYIYRNNEEKLCVTFNTNDNVTCGSRCEHLKGKEFEFDWNKIFID